MSRKAKLEGYAYDVAKRPHSTDPRPATALQACRWYPVAASDCTKPQPAARCVKRLPAPGSAASTARRKRQHAQASAVAHTRQPQRRPKTEQQQKTRRKDDPLCGPGSRRHRVHRGRRSLLAGRLPQHHDRRRRCLVLKRLVCRHQSQLGMEALQAHRVGRRL